MSDFLCPKCGELLTITHCGKTTATGVCACGHVISLVYHPCEGWLVDGKEPDVRWGKNREGEVAHEG